MNDERKSKPGFENSYWCCAADFDEHEADDPNAEQSSITKKAIIAKKTAEKEWDEHKDKCLEFQTAAIETEAKLQSAERELEASREEMKGLREELAANRDMLREAINFIEETADGMCVIGQETNCSKVAKPIYEKLNEFYERTIPVINENDGRGDVRGMGAEATETDAQRGWPKGESEVSPEPDNTSNPVQSGNTTPPLGTERPSDICNCTHTPCHHAYAALRSEKEQLENGFIALLDASECIRHWHDSGDDGMVVSRAHVDKLWDANEMARAILAARKPNENV